MKLVQIIDFSQKLEELYPLLERQVKLYTMGGGSSLPAETVLLRSVCFCIENHLTLSGKSAHDCPLVRFFEKGQRDVWRCNTKHSLKPYQKNQYGGCDGSLPH